MQMLKNINAVKARKNFGEIIEEVYYRGDQFVVERQGKAMAAVVPLAILEQWRKQRDEDLNVFEEIWSKNPSVDEKELEADVVQAVAQVRQPKQKAHKAAKHA